jgi:hypothetical protein
VLFGLLVALFLINAADWHYGFVDDREGYLVFPERILSEARIGRDPFHFRRIEAGLTAGGAYLYALFRAAVSVPQSRLADVGLGSVCLLLLVGEHAREYRASPAKLAGLLLMTLVIVIWSPAINNTPETMGKALLYALFRLAFGQSDSDASLRRGAGIALMFFAVIALKTSYLPAAAGALGAFYLFTAIREPRISVVREVIVVALVTVSLMMPWMMVTESIAGTFWYPLLGLGTLRPEETAGMVTPLRYLTDAGRLLLLAVPPILIAAAAWRSPKLERVQAIAGAYGCMLFGHNTPDASEIYHFRLPLWPHGGSNDAAILYSCGTPLLPETTSIDRLDMLACRRAGHYGSFQSD